MQQLPTSVLTHVLLGATDHADLVRHASVCARVHPEWWRTGRKRPGVQGAYLNPWASSYAPPYRLYGVF